MTDLRFEGRVFPAGLRISIRKHPGLEIRDADRTDILMRFDMTIEDGNVIVDCDVDNYSRDFHYSRLYIRASDIANAAVNLAAFAMGAGATVVFETVIESDGVPRRIVLRDRELESLCTSFSPNDERFDVVIGFVHADLRISRAIRDLTEAISGPHMIPSLCARAIETLRVLIVPRGVDRRQGWPLMQQHLNVSEDYLKAITAYGVAPRHGDHEFVPATATRMIATGSWTIMNRFLEYKKRGSQPLPLDEFPLL